MGFIEETGAAQYLRDAKILTIYEGTTAIQANDLVGRKTARDGGQTAKAIAAQIEKTEAELAKRDSAAARAVRKRLKAAREAFVDVVDFVAGQTKASPNAVFAGSVPYLMLAGNLVAGWQLARSLLVAEDAGRGRRRHRLHAGQDRHRALLCRAHPEQGARPARQHRRRRRERDGAGARRFLNPAIADHIEPRKTHMSKLPTVLANLPLPIIGSPLFIISNPKLVIAQCKAGVVGAMPALNARPAAQLEDWLARDHRRARGATTRPTRTSRPRPSPSTRSCTRATTGSSTTWRWS